MISRYGLTLALCLSLMAASSGCGEEETKFCSEYHEGLIADPSLCGSDPNEAKLPDEASFPKVGTACKPGDPDAIIRCGLNDQGEQTLRCIEGAYALSGACDDPHECVFGAHDTEACDIDGETGSRERDCIEGAWTEFSECVLCEEGERDYSSCSTDRLISYRTCINAQAYSSCIIDDYTSDLSQDIIIHYNDDDNLIGDHGPVYLQNDVDEVSVSFWFYRTRQTYHTMLRLGSGASQKFTFADSGVGQINASHLGNGYLAPEWVAPFLRNVTSTDRSWIHIAATFGAEEFALFVNGDRMTADHEDEHYRLTPRNEFFIDNAGQYYFGGIESGEYELTTENDIAYSHITIIDGVLSEKEVAILYASGASRDIP